MVFKLTGVGVLLAQRERRELVKILLEQWRTYSYAGRSIRKRIGDVHKSSLGISTNTSMLHSWEQVHPKHNMNKPSGELIYLVPKRIAY